MTKEEFEYAIKSCGCFIYRGHIYYEESELIKAFEDLGLIKQEPGYCDRNICLRNEYNNIGCNECEVTKSQEPSGDSISRKALKHKLQEHHDFFINDYGGFSNLPQNDKSRVDEISNCIAMVVNEPSVKPQEKTGHWKMMYEPENMVVCSECGKCAYLYNGRTSTWCPHCGNYKGAKNDT